jgi:hypothetical protein
MRRALETSHKARATLLATVPARRNRSAASRGIPREERASYKLAILPHIDNRPSTLPKKRRKAFEAHLRANIAKARERRAAGDAFVHAAPMNARRPGDTRNEAERDAEAKLLGAGCAACRGWCCLGGGDHAFNDVDTMRRYIEEFPTHDDEEIVARYLSYLAPRTLTKGCVYQHEHGCTLPRDLRADICNRFFCSHLDVIRNEYTHEEPVRAYFAHVKDGRLVGDRFEEIPVVDVGAKT